MTSQNRLKIQSYIDVKVSISIWCQDFDLRWCHFDVMFCWHL